MPYPNEHTVKLYDKTLFVDGSLKRKVIDTGVVLIAGRLKQTETTETQSYRFNTRYFDREKAREWAKVHDVQYLVFQDAGEPNGERAKSPDEIKVDSDLKEEFRYLAEKYCSFRVSGEEQDQPFVTGTGIVYNARTELYPGVTESIEPGAFSESLADRHTIKSFINHDPTRILSTTRSDPPLEILDGPKYLEFNSPIPPTSYGNDLTVNLQRGNINGASFSFSIEEDGETFTKSKDGTIHRTITKAKIYEVGPVTNPAYEQTDVGLRSKEFFEQLRTSIEKKNHTDKELLSIKEFLSTRKGL